MGKNIKLRPRIVLITLACAIIFFLTAYVHVGTWKADTSEQDVYYSWIEGRRILAGENPYTRILTGNMRENDKYARVVP